MIYYETDCTVNAKFGKLAGLSIICCIAGLWKWGTYGHVYARH